MCAVLCVNDAQKDGVFDSEEASFEFRKQKFVYSEAEHTFFKLRFPVQVSGHGLGFSKQGGRCHSTLSQLGYPPTQPTVHALQQPDSVHTISMARHKEPCPPL